MALRGHGKGRVSEVAFEDYIAWQEANMKPSANGTIQIPDGPIPGTTPFVFKGENPARSNCALLMRTKITPRANPNGRRCAQSWRTPTRP